MQRTQVIAVDELADHIVSLAIQRREEEDEQTQRQPSDKNLQTCRTHLVLHPLLKCVHTPCKIEAGQTADRS